MRLDQDWELPNPWGNFCRHITEPHVTTFISKIFYSTKLWYVWPRRCHKRATEGHFLYRGFSSNAVLLQRGILINAVFPSSKSALQFQLTRFRFIHREGGCVIKFCIVAPQRREEKCKQKTIEFWILRVLTDQNCNKKEITTEKF